MIIRRCQSAFDWLLEAVQLEIEHVENLWREEWGFFSGGDQDLLVYLLKTKYLSSYRVITRPNIQGRIEDFLAGEDKPLVTHLTGTYPNKLIKYCRLVKEFNGSRHMFDTSSGLYANDQVRVLYRIWTALARGLVAVRLRASRPPLST